MNTNDYHLIGNNRTASIAQQPPSRAGEPGGPASPGGPVGPGGPSYPAYPFHPENIPDELKALPQWLVWRGELQEGKNGEEPTWKKPPYDAKSRLKLNATLPSSWASFETALSTFQTARFDGIGFAAHEGDLFAWFDLDKCRNPETGELLPVVLEVDKRTGEIKRFIDPWEIIKTLNSYTEISPSGTGLRIVVKGTLLPEGRKKLRFECYHSVHFLTVTGWHLESTPFTIENRQSEIDALHQRIFARSPSSSIPQGGGPSRPRRGNGQAHPLPDQELLEKACNAENGDAFTALFDGDTSAYGGDHSAADLALCNMLLFWSDGDVAQADRIFRQSGLMRPKWDEDRGPQTYGQRTLAKALADAKAGYKGKGVHPQRGKARAKAPPPEVEGAITLAAPPPADPADPWPCLEPDDKPLHAATDLANAYRLASRCGHRLLHAAGAGWHTWTGTHWQRDHEGAVRIAEGLARLVAQDAAEKATQAAACSDSRQRDKLSDEAIELGRWAKQSGRRALIESALYLAAPMLNIKVQAMDQGPWLLNCTNGTLNLQTEELRPARRSDFISRCLPVAYDPKATCPTWQAFLERIFAGRTEVIRFMQKAMGYALSGDTREQCLFILHGSGQNGKSTLLDAIQSLLGSYAQQAAPDLLMAHRGERHPTELADLFGRRLITAVETGEGRRLNEPLIKQMTGGDRIRARFMRQDFFEFRPEFKLFLATNHRPVIRGTDFAIWRRIRLIPFEVTIPKAEQDKTLPARLQAELPGILAWAVEGCRLWLAEGLEPPEEVVQATEGYRAEMDTLAHFLEECCTIHRNAEAPAKGLYMAYEAWCSDNGERAESQASFGMRLTERGFERRRKNGIWWRGIGLAAAQKDPHFDDDIKF